MTASAIPRHVEVGDLLCEWFGHLAGYAGERPQFLSGWEVEPAGRPFAYAYYDWFKLVAADPQVPATIRRRLPRSDGVVTWEFRFRLPVVADGPAFALQSAGGDLLRLRVAGGMLIAVGAAGCRVAVAEVQAGRSCGLSIRLDLDAGSASIRCDGRQAAELSLAGAGRPPEGVLITTGAGFAGDLFLGPVLLHCGFALRERFLFTDPGAPPCGWTVQSAGGRAEVRACGGAAHPCDQLALCLDQVRPGALSATAACEPLAGPATVAAKWWIPQGGEGAALEVLAADGSVLAAIAVASGDFVGRGTAVATLWPRWQPTVWYDLELDLDPAAGTAAARINGIARGGFAIAAGRAVAGLRLRTAGQGAATVWADHLSIRPLLPPPADYPAEPRRVDTGDTLVLMQSCDLWREGSHVGWECIRPHPERKPLLGFYNGGDPEVEDWAISWMAANGISADFKCWYRGQPGFPLHSMRHGEGLAGFKRARWSGHLRFAINITNHKDMFTSLDDWRRHVVPYLIEHLFRDPRYLVVDGRPFLGIYDPHWLDRNTGDCGAAMAILREACRAAGFAGVWLVAQHRDDEAAKLADFARWGFDSVYAYTWFERGAAQQQERLLAHRAHGAIDILPTLSMGWDLRPWGGNQGKWLPAAEFRDLCAWARDTYMPAGAPGAVSRRVVMLDNWNEFGEGHCMLPSAGWGFGYLNAARDVFGRGPFPPDVVPTPAQAARLDTLYPRGDW